MKLHFLTIVLDGMPFVSMIYPSLRKLDLDWRWWVIEGVALPENCTKWCAKMPPRLSKDGTSQYLRSLAQFDPRVTIIAQPAWHGKISMFNEALSKIQDDEFLLWQVDSDEIWTAEQLDLASRIVATGSRNCAFFRCRYFVGPDLVITSRSGFGNHSDFEWKRLWRVEKGARFKSHEPPVLEGFTEKPWAHNMTEPLGLVFDHFAYATIAQMRMKAAYYGSRNNRVGHLYATAVEGWLKLQKAKMPVRDLRAFLPWVGAGVTVDRIAATIPDQL